MAELATKQLVLWLIAVLVFAIVIVAVTPFLRDKVIDWVKGFPEYKYGYEEEIDASKLSKDELAVLGCKFLVGAIDNKQRGVIIGRNERDLLLYDAEKKDWFKSSLYVNVKDEDNMEIKTGSTVIGYIKGNQVSIKGEFFEKENMIKIKEAEFLFSLDKATYIGTNYNLICGESEVKIEEIGEMKKIIDKLKGAGRSNYIYLVFDKRINDEIAVVWFFEKNSAGAIVSPNKGAGIKTEWIFLKENPGVLNSEDITSNIYPEDINIIKNLLGSKTPLELSENLQKALKTKRVSFDNDGNYDLTISQINVMLYNLPVIPEIEYEK